MTTRGAGTVVGLVLLLLTAALLRESQPRRVVAIKKDLAATVRMAINEAGLPPDRLSVLPFPLYQWRADYVRRLAELIGQEAI